MNLKNYWPNLEFSLQPKFFINLIKELRNVYEIYSNHEIIDTVFSDNFF